MLVLAGTALFQSSILIGGLPGWIGTGYGLVALAKIALFAVLLGFAARNRFRLTPALARPAGVAAKQALLRSIAGETGVGLLVVLAAGLLTSLPPAMHVQPLWPFAWRLSLDAVREDADFRREAVLAALALGGAAVLLAAALVVRHWSRWAMGAVAVAIAWIAAPHLGLLLADAYPTYYWHSPTGFASASIAQGAALYPAHCASCHGTDGRGNGPAAAGLPVPPADLTAAHLWMHADGELFWWLTHGIEAPDGRPAMPGFAAVLSEDQRWALIDWLRAHNAGLARAATGDWPLPVQAPGLEARCADAASVTLARPARQDRAHRLRLRPRRRRGGHDPGDDGSERPAGGRASASRTTRRCRAPTPSSRASRPAICQARKSSWTPKAGSAPCSPRAQRRAGTIQARSRPRSPASRAHPLGPGATEMPMPMGMRM